MTRPTALALSLTVGVMGLTGSPAGAAVLTFLGSLEDGVGLEDPAAIVVSSDGAHAYVAATGDHAIGIFARDPATGSLTPLGVAREGEGGVTGLVALRVVTLSPDDAHLYALGRVPSSFDSAVTVFSRDALTGLLTFVEVHVDGVAGVTGIRDPAALAMSPDGASVYVAGRGADAVAVFARNGSTGGLTFAGVLRDGIDGVDGLDRLTDLAVSADGKNVYATSWRSFFNGDGGIATFARDAATGALTFVELARFGDTALHEVTPSSDGAHVYAIQFEAGIRNLLAFARDPLDGRLSLVQTESLLSLGLGFAPLVVLSPGGVHLYVQLDREATLLMFTRDAATGLLSFGGADTDGGWVANVVGSPSISPDGLHVYVASGSEDSVNVYARDPLTGAVTFRETHTAAVGSTDGLDHVQGVAVAPDGRHVYTAAPGDRGIGVFARDPASGALSFLELAEMPFGRQPIAVVLTPDGANLYATDSSALYAFRRDAASGSLVAIDTASTGGFASKLATSPDGSRIYTVDVDGNGSATVKVFTADAGSDAITLVQEFQAPDMEFWSYEPMNPAAVSPDGRTLYVGGGTTTAAGFDDAIGAFELDAVSGLVAGVLQVIRAGDRQAGVGASLGVTTALVVSPDGRHVYAGSARDRVVSVFRRRPTGVLELRGVVSEGLSEFGRPGSSPDGLEGLAMTPDGGYLVVPGGTNASIAVFARRARDGALSLVEVQREGEGGVTGLRGAQGLAVSSDGQHLYAGADLADSLAAFAIDPCTVMGDSRLLLKVDQTDPVSRNDVLKLSGDLLLRTGTFATLNPAGSGFHLLLESATGVEIADVTLPGGAFAGRGTAGWFSNGTSTKWTFKDDTGTPANGILKVLLIDRGRRAPNLVGVRLRGRGGSYPVASGDEPVRVTIEADGGAQCGLMLFAPGGCRFDASGKRLKCA